MWALAVGMLYAWSAGDGAGGGTRGTRRVLVVQTLEVGAGFKKLREFIWDSEFGMVETQVT